MQPEMREEQQQQQENNNNSSNTFWRPVRRVLQVLFRFGAMRQKSFTTADRDREGEGERGMKMETETEREHLHLLSRCCCRHFAVVRVGVT